MKKLLAILLAACMIMGLALTASAKDTALADLDCSGWWTNHSEGIEVTEEGVTVTFTSTTYAEATDNWNGPIAILYAGDEAKVNGAGYLEYWVHRIDQYGWCNAAYYGAELNRWSPAEDLAAKGITATSIDSRTDGWANFLADLKAGVECTVTAKLEGSNCVLTFVGCGIDSTTILPIDTSKTTYLSLSGEKATLTNIVVTTPDPVVEPEVPSTPAEPAEDTVTELISSPITVGEGWQQVTDIASTNWGGTLAPSTLAADGYLTLNISATTEGFWNAHVALQSTEKIVDANGQETDWFQVSVEKADMTVNEDGTLTAKIPYETLLAAYGFDNFDNLGKIYIYANSETGCEVTVNSITYTVPAPEADDSNPKDGDSIAVVFALLAVSAAGIAVVAKKKEF